MSSYRLFLFRVVRVFSTMPRIAGFQKVLTINIIAIVLMVNFINSNVYIPLQDTRFGWVLYLSTGERILAPRVDKTRMTALLAEGTFTSL